VQYNFKNVSCEEFCMYVGDVPDLTRIGFLKNRLVPRIDI